MLMNVETAGSSEFFNVFKNVEKWPDKECHAERPATEKERSPNFDLDLRKIVVVCRQAKCRALLNLSDIGAE